MDEPRPENLPHYPQGLQVADPKQSGTLLKIISKLGNFPQHHFKHAMRGRKNLHSRQTITIRRRKHRR